MKKFYHRKLIRDKIPQIIESSGGKYVVRVMDEDEFRAELRKKLIEEAKEVQKSEKAELVKELADVLELLKSIAKSEGVNFKLVEEKRKQRKRERGGFRKRLFLVWSDKPAGK